ILALACDARHANLSTNHYISLFYKILMPQEGSLNYLSKSSFVLIWPTLSFLLLDAQSIDDQSMILEIMQKLIELKLKNINDRDVPPALISVAILPLFQVISDLEKSESRNTATEMLLIIQKFQALQYVPLEFNEVMFNHNATNLFNNISNLDYVAGFHSTKITINTSVHLHILHHALPSLVSTTDSTITAKVLKVTMSLVHRQEMNKETNLNAVGIRMLYKLWLRQRRCWKQLRFIISEWTKKRKLERSAYDDTKRERFEIELAVLSTIRDICKSKGRDYAEELLPFISSLLQSVILHPKSLYLIIETLNACIEAKVVETRAVWIVLMSYIADAIMQANPLNMLLVSGLCQFYKLIDQYGDDTDVYKEFKKNILESYLCPLIFPQKNLYTSNPDQEVHVDDSVLFKIQQDYRLLKPGLMAISQFNATDILSVFPTSSEILLSQIFNLNENLSQVEEWQFVLSKIISHEVHSMRR
ncbi:3118_t:CDS:2, partial [Racocetra persica]